MPPLRLNLGCSDGVKEGYLGVDIAAPADVICDLSGPWPWGNSTVDRIRAHDVFEHIQDKRHTMNEAWRVLVPGGQLDLIVPTTDGRGAFQDPTHRSFWTPNDLWYFTAGKGERERFGPSYGVTARFKVVKTDHRLVGNPRDLVWKLHALLLAVK